MSRCKLLYTAFRIHRMRLAGLISILFLLSPPATFGRLNKEIDSLQQAAREAKTDSARCVLMIRIAETYRYVNSDSATHYLTRAARLNKGLKSDYLDLDIALLDAIAAYEAGDYQASIRQLGPIEAKALRLDDERRLMKVYQTYGNSYGLANDHRQAIEYELKALDYAKKLKDTMAMAHLYVNIGSDFHYIKAYDKAIAYCSQARALYARLGQDFYQGFALNNLANYSKHLKDYRQALYYADEAARYWSEANNERLMAYLYHNYGDAYKGLKQYRRAERYYQKALAIRKKNEDSKDLLITSNELAALYLQWNRSDTALLLARKSYRMARQKAFAREMQQSAALLADIFEHRGDPGRALSYLKTSQALKDSLQARQQTLEVLRLQTRYETAEKENLILQQQNKITAAQLGLKTRNFWIFGLSSLTVMIGVTGFLLYQQQRLRNIKQKNENALQLALEKIEHRNRLQQQRLSISRDLHDNIGAQLTFIISAMDNLKHCTRDKDPGLIPRFEHISAFTKETMQELRDTVWAMNKADISLKDLQARIANFIEKAKQAHHAAEVSVAIDENVPATTHFTGIQGLNIYRIIQEATHNALKYAEAGCIQIRVHKSGQKLYFEIHDDGIGFDKQQYIPGNGIQHMHKRAAELGGTLQLTTAPGGGTKVILGVAIAEK